MTLLMVATAGCGGAMRGEPWTIECLSLRNPGHEQNTEAIAKVLRSADGIRGANVTVFHDAEESRILYGKYYRNIDRERGIREIPTSLRSDLAMIKNLYDDRGRRMFIGARMIRQPVPDVGPPEWNLDNADGVFSLQVAVFEPSAKFENHKQAAADYASQLRSLGHEAYYHHGEATSEVMVGAFGADAVTIQNKRTAYSPEVRRLQQIDIFKYNLVNGQIWHLIDGGRKVPVPSQLVPIPRRDDFAP